MKTLSIGKIVYDVNILMDGYPTEGSTNITKELVNCSGGSANIIAYSLSKWHLESYISGVIGYDDTGNLIKKNMEENKVKTTFLETNYDIKTPVSYIISNKQNNTKTTIRALVNDYNIKKYEYDVVMDLVISDGIEYNATAAAFNKYRNGITLLNAKDYSSEVIDFFKYAKYVVCDQKVAEAITGINLSFDNVAGMADAYKKIIDKYPNINLIITMEEGSIYRVGNEIKILANLKSEVVDKTGCKDIFVSMVGYGLLNGYNMDITLKLAVIAADEAKKILGATLSIPTLNEVVSIYESKFGKLVNPNETVLESTLDNAGNNNIQ